MATKHPTETQGMDTGPSSQAMVEYDQGNLSRAVELLLPLRHRLMETRGSD